MSIGTDKPVRTAEELMRRRKFAEAVRAFEDLLTGVCGSCSKGRECRAGCTSIAWSATGTVGCNPYCIRSLETESILDQVGCRG